MIAMTIFGCGLMWAIGRKGMIPESISELAYIMPHWVFSLWIALTAIAVMPHFMQVLPDSRKFIGFIAVLGVFIVASSAYYKTEARTLHYIGGGIAVASSQVVVALTHPWLLLAWSPLIGWLVWQKPKGWLTYIEIIAFILAVL